MINRRGVRIEEKVGVPSKKEFMELGAPWKNDPPSSLKENEVA